MSNNTPPLSNIQLELLKLFSDDISDNDLLEIKKLIAEYFSKKLTHQASKIWEEKGFSDEELINTRFRTPYGDNKK